MPLDAARVHDVVRRGPVRMARDTGILQDLLPAGPWVQMLERDMVQHIDDDPMALAAIALACGAEPYRPGLRATSP